MVMQLKYNPTEHHSCPTIYPIPVDSLIWQDTEEVITSIICLNEFTQRNCRRIKGMHYDNVMLGSSLQLLLSALLNHDFRCNVDRLMLSFLKETKNMNEVAWVI